MQKGDDGCEFTMKESKKSGPIVIVFRLKSFFLLRFLHSGNKTEEKVKGGVDSDTQVKHMRSLIKDRMFDRMAAEK